MKCVQFLCHLSIFDLAVALSQRHSEVWTTLEQMDCLDEALHDVHHKLAVGGDQLASSREYRGRVEGIYREGIPTVANFAGKAQIDWQRARVDLSGCQRSIDSIEFNQGQVDRGGARFLDCDPGRHAGLP